MSEWIRVIDRLPKINEKVLISTTRSRVCVGYRKKPTELFQVEQDGFTLWMYIHEVPGNCIKCSPKAEDCSFQIDFVDYNVLSITSPNYHRHLEGVLAWMPIPYPYYVSLFEKKGD